MSSEMVNKSPWDFLVLREQQGVTAVFSFRVVKLSETSGGGTVGIPAEEHFLSKPSFIVLAC